MEPIYILLAIVVVIIMFFIMYIWFRRGHSTSSASSTGSGNGNVPSNNVSNTGTNNGSKRSPLPENLKLSTDKATTLMDIENENGVLYDSDRRAARSTVDSTIKSKPQRLSKPSVKSSFSFDSFVHYNGNDLYGMPEYSARFAPNYDIVSLNSLNELDIRPHGQLISATDMDIVSIGQNKCPKMHEYRSVRDFLAINRSKFTPSRTQTVDYYCSYPQTLDSVAYENIVEPTTVNGFGDKTRGSGYLFEYDATMTVVPTETVFDDKVLEFNYVHFTQRRKTLEFESLLQFIRAVNTLEQQYGDKPMIMVGTFNVQAENYLYTLFDQSKFHVCSFNENPTHMVNGIDARVHDGLIVSKKLYPRIEYWTRYNDYVTTNDESLVLECRLYRDTDSPGTYTYGNWRDKSHPMVEDRPRVPNPELQTLKAQFREIMFKSKTPTAFPTTVSRLQDYHRHYDKTAATAPPSELNFDNKVSSTVGRDSTHQYVSNAINATTTTTSSIAPTFPVKDPVNIAGNKSSEQLPPPAYDELTTLAVGGGGKPVSETVVPSKKLDAKTGLQIFRDTSIKNINKLFTTLNNNGK